MLALMLTLLFQDHDFFTKTLFIFKISSPLKTFFSEDQEKTVLIQGTLRPSVLMLRDWKQNVRSRKDVTQITRSVLIFEGRCLLSEWKGSDNVDDQCICTVEFSTN